MIPHFLLYHVESIEMVIYNYFILKDDFQKSDFYLNKTLQ